MWRAARGFVLARSPYRLYCPLYKLYMPSLLALYAFSAGSLNSVYSPSKPSLYSLLVTSLG